MEPTRRDYSFRSGERQTAEQYEGNRADHKLRYELAANQLKTWFAKESPEAVPSGLDMFCGSGYGSWLLAKSGMQVLAYDGSEESIEFARSHYASEAVDYRVGLYPFSLSKEAFDYAVCFESIEHVEDDAGLLKTIVEALRPGAWLFLSTPNEDILSFERFKYCYPFHYRHYSYSGLMGLIEENTPGLELVNWYGQDTYNVLESPPRLNGLLPEEEMGLRERYVGQTLLFVFRKRY